MAKSKVPLIMKASFTSTTAEQIAGEVKVIDLSAYVDPLSGKVLQITRVSFSVDMGTGAAIPTTMYEADAPNGTMQLTTGTQTGLVGPQDDRNIASSQYYYQAVDTNGASTAPSWFSVIPVPKLGFFVAADSITFMNLTGGNPFDDDVRFAIIIEAMRVKLTTADINFLLVNQTFTG
jgi:hypothetical protein